jgi:hypothetical protein
MMQLRSAVHAILLGIAIVGTPVFTDPTYAASKSINCQKFHIDATAASALQQVVLPPPQGCAVRMSNGFPIPDPNCTPGAINPTLKVKVLRDPSFRTSCVRSHATSEDEKFKTYNWYHIRHPKNNKGSTQTCELDHLISLELGGADTLENIWPQCGPPSVKLRVRYFKQKDIVENFLAAQVKAGKMDLAEVQKGIAEDWTQYLDTAKKAQATPKRRKAKRRTTH